QLATILTTDLLPVDLNAFLYTLEQTIAELAAATGEARAAQEFGARASRRADAINRVFWDPRGGFYVDYDWRRKQRRRCLTAATTVPLYCGVASQQRAQSVAQAVCARLLAPGGVRGSECASGQQWDSPNGWAPLQWMAAEGFARYGLDELAADIRSRWLATVQELFRREGKLVEKYALRPKASHPAGGGGGGEYPLQDGFGWTNGVTRRWLHETGGGE
ncbi:MAG: trehalase family glycosidase, partial [Ramlibacter sp.]